MTEPLSAGRPDFFGKDSFVPFIGTVEDVNDPTHSGRVKVRCVGWHPKDRKETQGNDDSLSTDDLPWARVGMPVTHAQQARVGGKHGLLPGCWVMGFFLDGEEAQDPFILNTFNFTSKTSQRDNRKNVGGETGKLEEQAEGYDKILISKATQPNTALRTTDEQRQEGFSNTSDPAGDNANEDSDDECNGKAARESAASKAAKEEAKVPENPVGQVYSVTVGDGQCGSNPHAAEDVQLKMEERLPSELARFNYNDAVWERFQGNFMDLNGILAQLALEICALLKQNVMSIKSEQEEINRTTDSQAALISADRDAIGSIQATETVERTSDIFHAVMGQFIDQLCGLVMGLLQQQQNAGGGGGGGGEGDNNAGGNIGADAVTDILNPGAPCVADTFMNNFNALVVNAVNDAQAEAERVVQDAIENNPDDDGSGSSLDQIMGLLSGFAAMGTGMVFPLVQKYADRTDVHNTQGDASQDQTTREGCKDTRQYNTETGYSDAASMLQGLGGGGGGGGAGGGGGGGDDGDGGGGRGANRTRADWGNINFGGMENPTTGVIDFTTCEDGQTPAVPDDNTVDTEIPSPGTGVDWPVQPPRPVVPTPTDQQVELGTGADLTGILDDGTLDSIPTGQVNTYPAGYNAVVTSLSLPSSEEACAKNFIDGTPNVAVITNPGKNYFYHNKLEPEKAFLSVSSEDTRVNPQLW